MSGGLRIEWWCGQCKQLMYHEWAQTSPDNRETPDCPECGSTLGWTFYGEMASEYSDETRPDLQEHGTHPGTASDYSEPHSRTVKAQVPKGQREATVMEATSRVKTTVPVNTDTDPKHEDTADYWRAMHANEVRKRQDVSAMLSQAIRERDTLRDEVAHLRTALFRQLGRYEGWPATDDETPLTFDEVKDIIRGGDADG